MKKALVMSGLLAAILFTGHHASADWGDGQDIADQWGDGSNAYGGSGNPYSGGYHGTSPHRRDQDQWHAHKKTRKPIRRPRR